MEKEILKVDNIKDMLEKTGKLYGDNIAYIIKKEPGKYVNYTHKQVRDMVNSLGEALLDLELKGKRIAVIGENRMEWEISYLSIVSGVGIVVPLDKALPKEELASLIKRSKVEGIFYSKKYQEMLDEIINEDNDLKYLFPMDGESELSFNKLIEKGNEIAKTSTLFKEQKIDANAMSIMLFTSGTTSASKVVALSHNNICSNLMILGTVLDLDDTETFLSVLPVHHVFECTVGFLFALYLGAKTAFSDGIRHLVDNLKEYEVTFMANVPAIYERFLKIISKNLEKEGKLEDILEKEEEYKNASMEKKKEIFKEIHDMFGGRIKFLISGAAYLDPNIEGKFRRLGFRLVQGYGLTETSPVVAVGTNYNYRTGSIGVVLPNQEVMIDNPNDEGIGELLVKGPNVMLGYYENEEATKEAMAGGWFHTGDLARIDEDGYIFICGRKKSVIVLKNGKNIFPEEMEGLINKIPCISESFVFGKKISQDDETNIKINAKLVYSKEDFEKTYDLDATEENVYKIFKEEIKKINSAMPNYKAIRGLIISEEPLIKTTTNKIKRQDNLNEIEKQEFQVCC